MEQVLSRRERKKLETRQGLLESALVLFRENGYDETTVEEITDKGVRVSRDGASEFIRGDTVVLALGYETTKQLAEELEGRVAELYSVGDCAEPRTAKEAIEEGFLVGLRI